MFTRSLVKSCQRIFISYPSQLKLSGKFYSGLNVSNKYLQSAGKFPDHTSRNLNLPKHLSVTSTDDPEAAVDCEYDLMDETEQDIIESENKQFCLRQLLYPDSKDEVIQRLNGCTGPVEVLELFEELELNFTEKQATQFIILLWSCMRCSDKETIRKTYVQEFINSNRFESFLNRLLLLSNEMNYDELTCCLLYLHKIGIDSSRPFMQELFCKMLSSINNVEADIPLSALSRLSVAINSNKDIYTFLSYKNIVPHIVKQMKNCKTAEDIRLLTICMHNAHQFITDDTINIYKEKIQQMIDSGQITSNDFKCILKAINFLNFPHWSQNNTKLVRSLLILLNDEILKLSSKDLEIVFRVFQSQLEPATIIPNLKKAANDLFQRSPSSETLACAAQFIEPNRRKEMTSIVKDMIASDTLTIIDLQHLFKVLRSLKISNQIICDSYWSRVLQEIVSNPTEKETYRIARYCHRYMHFNNNLGGTYRHERFENALVTMLMDDIENGIAGIVPSKFVRLASFVIAYGGKLNANEGIPKIILEKIEKMSKQFTLFDALQLSRGLQIALEMRFRNYISPEVAPQLIKIGNILDECAERHLEEDLSLQDLNYVIRSFNNRRASRKTQLFQKIMDRYKDASKYLNSRIIRDLTFNFNLTNYIIPEICDDILRYLEENRFYVTGDTVEKVLTCCYNIGYLPESTKVFHWSAEIIKRDFKFMNSLAIVQACLALCFYKALPESLTSKVFAIDFIQRIEEEIKTCYSKESYPERVLNQVMQLNRAVCLDYPESQVPWFQQNYIEAQMTKQPNIQSKFYSDIKRLLVSVVENEFLLKCNHVTPYGYRVDFVVHLNKNNKVIAPPKDNAVLNQISKVAILLQKLDSFCENKFTAMKGSEHLKLRHLEILGYKVIHINFNDWNSMYMNVPGAKANYLKNLLQIQ